MDWAKFIAEEAKTSAIIRSDVLANRLRIPIQSLRVALGRQAKRGLVERITRKIYANKLAPGLDARDIAAAICPESYVSLDSALNEWGASTQSPAILTCISSRRVAPIATKAAQIEFHTIKKPLFWGFNEKKTRFSKYHLADPEKAFLDWIYIRRKEGLPLALDEIEFQRLSRSKLLRYAKKYPKTILQFLYPVLAEEQFAA